LNSRLIPIDGDDLGVGMERTLKLGKERNDFTLWKCYEALMRGCVPVISTGGGSLFSNGKNQSCVLRNQISHMFGISVKIIVVISGKASGFIQVDNNYDPTLIYNDLNPVKKTVSSRVESGVWNLDKKFGTIQNFANFIATKSKNNCEFAKKLIADANAVFIFPAISKENYGIQQALDYSELTKAILYPHSSITGHFGQVRFLTFIDNDQPGHITIQFTAKSDIVMSIDKFDELNKFYDKEINGNIIICKSDNGKEISFAMPEKSFHDDGSSHITLNSGIHVPKEMRNAALGIKNKTSFGLVSKDHNIIQYELKNITITPCKINIICSFGIF
jgi:hypothetical protein